MNGTLTKCHKKRLRAKRAKTNRTAEKSKVDEVLTRFEASKRGRSGESVSPNSLSEGGSRTFLMEECRRRL